jgi:iron complex outermembrane receptor protein
MAAVLLPQVDIGRLLRIRQATRQVQVRTVVTSRLRRKTWRLALVALVGCAQPASAQTLDNLGELSLENLLSLQVTSVSRRTEEFLTTPAAAHVITQEDIRRSGLTDLADVLRLAPGVNVARVNGSTWAISIRGFMAQYATKLLVLVDGRSVYDPGFSGVFWNLQNLLLEDIDRIEIIRGPGATMWGANAVNGVINITTKRTANTQGGMFVADAGSGRPGEGGLRFGGALGGTAFYRVFARQTTRSTLEADSGGDAGDGWNRTDVGVRVDWDPSPRDTLTVDGGASRGVNGSPDAALRSLAPVTFQPVGLQGVSASHLAVGWTRSLAASSDMTLRFYVNHASHRGYGAKDLDIVDIDLLHNVRVGARQSLVWGVGYRESRDAFEETLEFGVTPAKAMTRLVSAFVQDDVTIVPGRLWLTAGSKFEHSSLTRYNVQPAVRGVWLLTPGQSVWATISRAVRTANRVERGMHVIMGSFPAGDLTAVVELRGQPAARSEELMAHEAGYRHQLTPNLSVDVAAFYNVYDDVSSPIAGDVVFRFAPAPHLVLPLVFDNEVRGSTHGVEAAVTYATGDRWTVKGAYSALRMQLRGRPGDTGPADLEGQSPRNQLHVASSVRLPFSLRLSNQLYVTGPLPFFQVPGYTRLDANLAWKASDRVEIALVGQNLLGSHLEFGELPSAVSLVRPAVHGRIAWMF